MVKPTPNSLPSGIPINYIHDLSGKSWEYMGIYRKLYPHFPHGPLVVQSHDSHDLPQKASVHLFQKASSRSRRSSSGSFMRLVVFLRASGAFFFDGTNAGTGLENKGKSWFQHVSNMFQPITKVWVLKNVI